VGIRRLPHSSTADRVLAASDRDFCHPHCALLRACLNECEGAVCLSRQWEERTRKDGENRLMDGLYLPCVQYVACEEGYYEQHYQDGQGP
jgi:hypothetical protein